MPRDEALVKRVQSSFQQLSEAATHLNKASDGLGKLVTELDSALKRLNIGIQSWVDVSRWTTPDGLSYGYDQLGYDKIDGTWGIALQTCSGDERDDGDTIDGRWLFNDAPRQFRIRAVDHIPALLDKIATDATSTAAKIEEKTQQIADVVAAIKPPATEKTTGAKTSLSGAGRDHTPGCTVPLSSVGTSISKMGVPPSARTTPSRPELPPDPRSTPITKLGGRS